MTYEVVFSLEAAAELVRIAGAVRPASAVIQAAESIRQRLAGDPLEVGRHLSEEFGWHWLGRRASDFPCLKTMTESDCQC